MVATTAVLKSRLRGMVQMVKFALQDEFVVTT